VKESKAGAATAARRGRGNFQQKIICDRLPVRSPAEFFCYQKLYLHFKICGKIILMENERSESWRDIVPILLLFYIPPVGAIVMWMISRWSNLTKWILTILIGIIPIVVLGGYSYGGYQLSKFQKSYAPVLEVQQALDIYGIQNGKYPATLEDLTPKYIKEIPAKDLQYTLQTDGSGYTLTGKVEGKTVNLGPALKTTE